MLGDSSRCADSDGCLTKLLILISLYAAAADCDNRLTDVRCSAKLTDVLSWWSYLRAASRCLFSDEAVKVLLSLSTELALGGGDAKHYNVVAFTDLLRASVCCSLKLVLNTVTWELSRVSL